MYRRRKLLAFAMFVGHLGLASALIFDIGPTGNAPVWSVLAQIWFDWGSPALFGAVSLFAFVGWNDTRFLRMSFYLAALLMFTWAGALIYIWVNTGNPQMAATWLPGLGVVKWCIADIGFEHDRQTAGVIHLTSEVEQTLERHRDASNDPCTV